MWLDLPPAGALGHRHTPLPPPQFQGNAALEANALCGEAEERARGCTDRPCTSPALSKGPQLSLEQLLPTGAGGNLGQGWAPLPAGTFLLLSSPDLLLPCRALP